MYLSEFLAKHLKYSFETVECGEVCKMCGKGIRKGVLQKDIIKSTFTDYQYLRYDSRYLCPECCALIGRITLGDNGLTWLRNFSFIATEDSFRVLKREKLLSTLINPPDPPFVLCITYSNKKHISFKSRIQLSNKVYSVFTDKGEVEIAPHNITELLKILISWYTVLPDKQNTKQQPTWLTKGEILNGGKNYKNINAYGLGRYQEENLFIEQYRETSLLKLLTFALNKKIDYAEGLNASENGQLKF